MKKIILLLLLSIVLLPVSFAQDTVFVYRKGKIIQRIPENTIDSISTFSSAHWNKKLSDKYFNYLQNIPEISKFVKMIEIAGLSKRMTEFDVFAPVNSKLDFVELTDTMQVMSIVKNQIMQRGRYSGYMLNGKYFTSAFYSTEPPSITRQFHLPKCNIYCVNDTFSRRQNLMDYIFSKDCPDNLSSFLKKYSYQAFNPINSEQIQKNSLLESMKVYFDAEILKYCFVVPPKDMWKHIEDSLYSLIPATTDTSTIDASMDNVRSFMLKSLISKYVQSGDTIWTIGGLSNNQPTIDLLSAKFGKTKLINRFSNGICVQPEKMDFLLEIPRKIVLEAEDRENCWGSNNTQQVMALSDSTLSISNGKFVQFTPITISDILKSECTFQFAIKHPGTYSVYACVLPGKMLDSTNTSPNTLTLQLKSAIAPSTDFITDFQLVDYVTGVNGVQKIRLTDHLVVPKFDGTSAYHKTYQFSLLSTALSNTTATFDRTFSVDCIVIERNP